VARRSERSDKRRGQTRVEKVLNRHAPKDVRWHQVEKCHELVFDLIERLSRLNGPRRRQDLYHACLYDDAEFATLLNGSQAIGAFTPQTMTSNIVKRQVDAFVAKLTKNRPVPMALTSGGTHSEQRRAKSLSKVFEGVLEETGYWDTRPLLRRDGAVFGSGVALNYRIGNKLFHDRCYPWEFLVDPREAMYGKPRTLILRRYVDKLVMMERYPEHAEAIFNSQGKVQADNWHIGWDETSDLVLCAWIWHLPSAEPTEKDAKGGSFALCVSEATLEHLEYRRDTFPVSKWDYSPGLCGYWGEGMAKQLSGLQYEVNAIGLRLQEQGYMTGTFVWTPTDDGFESEQIDNGVFTHIVSPHKPEFFNPAPWHPQFFDYYLNLRGRFPAEETRLSEMATRGEKPPGLDSGVALRAWNDLDSEAFLPQGREDERDAIDTAWQFFDLLEEIHEESKGKGECSYTVQVEERKHGQTLLQDADWSKVRLDQKKFTLKTFPTSLLTGTPAEKYQQAKEIAADGLLSIDEVYALLDIPDIQRVLNLRGAPRRAIEKILEGILEADDPAEAYVHPEPAFNLELCRAVALLTYLDAFTHDTEPEKLRWVLQFAIDAELEMESAEEATAPLGEEGAPAGDPALDPGMGELPPEMAGGLPPEELFAPPEEQPLPGNALPPEAMAAVPGM
jgi:hypothetical protein